MTIDNTTMTIEGKRNEDARRRRGRNREELAPRFAEITISCVIYIFLYVGAVFREEVVVRLDETSLIQVISARPHGNGLADTPPTPRSPPLYETRGEIPVWDSPHAQPHAKPVFFFFSFFLRAHGIRCHTKGPFLRPDGFARKPTSAKFEQRDAPDPF